MARSSAAAVGSGSIRIATPRRRLGASAEPPSRCLQNVEGSSPFIRFSKPCKWASCVVLAGCEAGGTAKRARIQGSERTSTAFVVRLSVGDTP
jgi:hypothetical protein